MESEEAALPEILPNDDVSHSVEHKANVVRVRCLQIIMISFSELLDCRISFQY